MEPTVDATIAAQGHVAMDSHLSTDDVAALIDGTLSVDQRRALDEHLALCEECRAELIGASRAVASAPRVAKHRVASGTAIAAAALILVAVGLPLVRTIRRPDPRSIIRSARAPSDTVTLASPRNNSALFADSVRFVWRRDGDARYRLIVTDSVGAQLFAIPTSDTVANAPLPPRFAPGATYFWYVDAIRLDGSSVTSGTSTFTIRGSR